MGTHAEGAGCGGPSLWTTVAPGQVALVALRPCPRDAVSRAAGTLRPGCRAPAMGRHSTVLKTTEQIQLAMLVKYSCSRWPGPNQEQWICSFPWHASPPLHTNVTLKRAVALHGQASEPQPGSLLLSAWT